MIKLRFLSVFKGYLSLLSSSSCSHLTRTVRHNCIISRSAVSFPHLLCQPVGGTGPASVTNMAPGLCFLKCVPPTREPPGYSVKNKHSLVKYIAELLTLLPENTANSLYVLGHGNTPFLGHQIFTSCAHPRENTMGGKCCRC